VIDSAVPQIVSRFQALYPQRSVAELVLMGSHASQLESVDSRELLADIHQLLPQQQNVANYYPYLYVDAEDNSRLTEVCEVMSMKLNPHNIGVYCPGSTPLTAYSLLAVGATATNTSGPTQAQIETYQIELWVSIAGVFVVAWAAYVIGWMGFKKDTLLYSTFNPNWEDRKRR